MHNLNDVHVDENAVETSFAISSLQSGKDLPDPYKGSIDEETPTVVAKEDSSYEDEEEHTRAKPNPDI